MISLDELKNLVASQQEKNECFREFVIASLNELLNEVGPGEGRLTADSALKTFQIRERTTREAGVKTCGFLVTLENLRLRPANEVISLRTLKTANKIFSIFISESSHELIGCICVPARNLEDPDLIP